uniref:Uncharacterized protein n=1 Tax=Neospora caninum (strain Liverpool) TaxID=572307 RepID=A0A0F7UFR4_NEOCL|nr:TPA: hypothetical protein BN1204_036180 [Neospora caninum Liverpool]
MAYASTGFSAAEATRGPPRPATSIPESVGISSAFTPALTQQEKYDVAVLDMAVRSSWGRDFNILLQFAREHAAHRAGLSVERLDRHLVKRARVFRAVDQEFVQFAGLALGSEDGAVEFQESLPCGQSGGLWSGMTKESLKWCAAKLRLMCDEQEPSPALALEEIVALKCTLFAEAQGAGLRQAQRRHRRACSSNFPCTTALHSSSSCSTLLSQPAATCLPVDLFFDMNTETLLRTTFKAEQGNTSILRLLLNSLNPNRECTVPGVSSTLPDPTESSVSRLISPAQSRPLYLSPSRRSISSDMLGPSAGVRGSAPSHSTRALPAQSEEAGNAETLSKNRTEEAPKQLEASGSLVGTLGTRGDPPSVACRGESRSFECSVGGSGERSRDGHAVNRVAESAEDTSSGERGPGTRAADSEARGNRAESPETPQATLRLLFQLAELHLLQRLTQSSPDLVQDAQATARGFPFSTMLFTRTSRQGGSSSRFASASTAPHAPEATVCEESGQRGHSRRPEKSPSTGTAHQRPAVELRGFTLESTESLCQQGLKRKDTISDLRVLPPAVAREVSTDLGTDSRCRRDETRTPSLECLASQTTDCQNGKRRKFHFKSEDPANPGPKARTPPQKPGGRSTELRTHAPSPTTPIHTPVTSQADAPLFQLLDDRTGVALCRVLQTIVMRDVIASCACPSEDEACVESVATSLDLLVEIIISLCSLLGHLQARSSASLHSAHPSQETAETSERGEGGGGLVSHPSSPLGDSRDPCFERDRKGTTSPRLSNPDAFLSEHFEGTLIDLVALPFCYGFCVLALSPWHRKLQQRASTGFYRLVRSLDRLLCLNSEALDVACRLFNTQTKREQNSVQGKDKISNHGERYTETADDVRMQEKGRGTLCLLDESEQTSNEVAKGYTVDPPFELSVCSRARRFLPYLSSPRYAQVVESPHPYPRGTSTFPSLLTFAAASSPPLASIATRTRGAERGQCADGNRTVTCRTVEFPGASHVFLLFDERCNTQHNTDILYVRT